MIKKASGARLIWAGVILLIILRQDIWFWHDRSLVFGMFPVGLAWQIGISIAAAILWYAATHLAWPVEVPVEAPPATERSLTDQPRPNEAQEPTS